MFVSLFFEHCMLNWDFNPYGLFLMTKWFFSKNRSSQHSWQSDLTNVDKKMFRKANTIVFLVNFMITYSQGHSHPDKDFKLIHLTQFMRKQGLPWKEIFWKVFGAMQTFYCVNCNKNFFGTDLYICTKHPCKPNFNGGANVGYYLCCGTPTLRFSERVNLSAKGC